ncbi:MAG TPA: flagellin [Solirubrobacteraceae bacterium]|jgi:flagellin|nr:flagellin [Solirubrobacteraceae bacterium]
MGLTINNNLEAMDASRNLNGTENSLSTAMQRLSSGLKINSAADDVAGYAISQSLQSQVNGLNQAGENIQDAVALAQTAQGALNDVNGMLQRVRELSVEYANGTTSEEDQKAIISEVGQLTDEIKRVGETTSFNGKNLLNASEEIKFQVGANDGESISVSTIKLYSAIESKLEPATLGERLLNGLGEAEKEEVKEFKKEIETEEKEITKLQETLAKGGKTEAEVKEVNKEITEFKTKVGELNESIAKLNKEHPPTGLKELDEAISTVSGLAGEFGAVQDRIQYTQANLEVYSQNLTSAVSAMVDVNMATEMTNFTKLQVLQQAGVAILSQANQLPDAALKLIE